jgi:multiple sugar transport system substrate-binding protein
MRLTRRSFIGGSAAFSAAASLRGQPALAAEKLTVLAVSVHKAVALGNQGGDITAAWRRRNAAEVEWITFASQPAYERLMREVSLKETQIDVGYLLNTQALSRVTNLFEPLDEYLRAAAIEDFDDIFPNMVNAMRFDGKLYGIPVRHAVGGLHYNEQFLEERGLSGPPRTAEELVEHAKKLTYTRADGTKVVGFILSGYPSVVGLARAWDGDYIRPDMKVVANEPPMVRAISALREMYAAGAFPSAFVTGDRKEDQNTWMQTGRAAMCITPTGRYSLFNDPQKSKFAGRIKTTAIPAGAEFRSKFEVAPANIEFWSLVIPKNSRRKEQAWSFIREISSKENTLKSALNGNGPVRNSTYGQPSFAQTLPYVADEQRALKVARPPMPAFENAAKADDYFVEAFEKAMLGLKTPQEAMDELVARVTPLTKSSG